jgi:hypothetical protein
LRIENGECFASCLATPLGTERGGHIKQNHQSDALRLETERRNSMTERCNSMTERRNSMTERRNSMTERRNSMTERRNSMTEDYISLHFKHGFFMF